MKQGRKILFCDNVLWGLVNFRGSVIRHFVQQGDEVVLVAPQDDESIMKVDIPEGVRYIPVRLNRCSRNPFTDLIYCAHLYRIYRKEHPDYIFHYTIKPMCMAVLLPGWPALIVRVWWLAWGMASWETEC